MERYLNPNSYSWDGPDADYTPVSDDIPWCMVPEKKVTVEDVKYVLSSHYQGTPYDPYGAYGDKSMNGAYRSIGINRNDFMSLIQMRPDQPEDSRAIEWVAFASNAFNVMAPFYADIDAANLCRIESGKYSVGLDILTKIGYALGMEIDFVEPKHQ